MQFDVVTALPGIFQGPLRDGVLGRGIRDGVVTVRIHDLRRWGIGRHRIVDDTPYGGGGGMILRPEPFFEAVDWIEGQYPADRSLMVLLSPQGTPLSHGVGTRLAGYDRVVLLCGRYEGIDERVREGLADEELSIGDYVLTGGELPAMVVMDAVSRFVKGTLGRGEAAEADSFADGHLDSPYYTRPSEYRGMAVPEVLMSGNHKAISAWRGQAAHDATRSKRPDLLGRKDD